MKKMDEVEIEKLKEIYSNDTLTNTHTHTHQQQKWGINIGAKIIYFHFYPSFFSKNNENKNWFSLGPE